jgi:membrane associated rhomboid family serine protease
MLIPIGRDDAEIRRHAWVSYAIIALNIVAFVVLGLVEREATRSLELRWRDAIEYHVAHPYLRTPKSMADLIGPQGMTQLALMRKNYGPGPISRLQAEQAKLDELANDVEHLREEHPLTKVSYIPARGGALSMFTSMFVHADFFHLLGNLLFFFLSGPFIEDVFGRPLFAFLYFVGGIVAVLTFATQHPDSVIRLVGASGAIAAVMGAYLVRFARSKVEFLFIPILFRPTFNFRFWLPAFVVLPLWFVQQLLEMRSEAGGGGVAFSAHVGGFLFGVVVALIVKATRFEEKFVNPLVLQQTTWTMDERLVRAMDARKVGNLQSAQRELDSLLRDPKSPVEALQIAMDVAQETEDFARYDAAATRLLTRHLEAKNTDLAMDLIREVTDDRHARVPKFLGRAAPVVERSGDREWALTLYERLYDSDPASPAAVPSLVKIGTLLRASGDLRGAREALTKARAHPGCTAEWAPSIDAKIAQLG